MTTISTGSVVARGSRAASAAKPCFDSKRSGSAVTPLVPIVHPEDRRREGEQHGDRQSQAEPRPPQHAPHDRAPEAPFGVGCLERAPADERDPQRVDAVAEQPQQRRQQGQRGDHRDDADEDRADGEAAHDRAGHDQHPEHRDHEGRAAEDDGAVRRRRRTPRSRRAAPGRGRAPRGSARRRRARSRSRARAPCR